MRHRRILFGLAILLSAGIVLYARSRTRRQQLIRRAGDVREGVSARAVTSPDGEAGPETGETIAASAADVPSTDEPEPVPAAETVAPIPIRRRETPTARAKRVTSESRLPVRQLAGAALIIAAMAWSFGALRGASAAPTTYVNSPVADAFVWATQPSNNYGASKSIRVDGSPLMASYLRFDVPALDGPVTRATLMVYANSRSSAGWDVHAVADSTWGERTITFNNAPPMGSATFASSGAFAGGDWTSADVTSLVTGSGPLSVALTTSGGTQVNLASRESGANAPRLVIETAGSSVAATSTATSSAPPTATSTAVPTTVPPTSTATSVAPPATATATSTSGGGGSATLPLRAAFYYPWFSPAWTQQGIYPYTKYHPALGFYDERDQATVKAHIAAMQYGNISAGIASWWGQGSYTDARVNDLLTAAAGTGFQWAIYYENESQGDPSVSQLTGDLVYIRDHYASNANFLKINGKFVVFVYADAADACGMADRWRQANTVGAYVVLKVFPGYMTCASQPDGWHQYAPAVAADSQGSYSYAISPGFDKVGEATRLARDLTRWQQNVADMAASSAAFQLVTTFNEWGEGTAVESATEWTSPSGYGSYLDALHNSPVTGTTPPTATPPAATATPPPALTPTPTPTVAPPTASPTATSVPPTPTASPTPGGSSTLSFAPVADAYVHSQAPDSNYGTGTSLRVDGSPIVESYLRFDVQGAGSITSATLKVWATSNQSAGYEVHGVADNSWSETGITFNNAPSFDTAGAGSSGPVAASSWTSVDVTSLVSGNGPVSFALLTPSVTALALSSRESGATAPQLVITTDSGAGGGPTPTATATQSGPTPAPTATATAAPPTPTATPALPTPTVPPGASVTFVGAGDIAGCSSSGDEATGALVKNIPGTVFTLGDNAYENGTATEYANCYDPSWGAFRDRTRPAPGNHDYNTPNGTPYYAYFGANAGDPTKGYYSYNLGSWHIVVLNGMCSAVGGCGLNSPQEKWLKADLAANATSCTLAYWHFPLFSSGATHGNNPAYRVFWDDLYAAGAEVVLNGHEHNYERFAPQTSSAVADAARGIREFVVGTGGKNHYGFGTVQPNSEVRNSTAFGVLKLTLNSSSYSWQFVPVAGQSFTDSGTTSCH